MDTDGNSASAASASDHNVWMNILSSDWQGTVQTVSGTQVSNNYALVGFSGSWTNTISDLPKYQKDGNGQYLLDEGGNKVPVHYWVQYGISAQEDESSPVKGIGASASEASNGNSYKAIDVYGSDTTVTMYAAVPAPVVMTKTIRVTTSKDSTNGAVDDDWFIWLRLASTEDFTPVSVGNVNKDNTTSNPLENKSFAYDKKYYLYDWGIKKGDGSADRTDLNVTVTGRTEVSPINGITYYMSFENESVSSFHFTVANKETPSTGGESTATLELNVNAPTSYVDWWQAQCKGIYEYNNGSWGNRVWDGSTTGDMNNNNSTRSLTVTGLEQGKTYILDLIRQNGGGLNASTQETGLVISGQEGSGNSVCPIFTINQASASITFNFTVPSASAISPLQLASNLLFPTAYADGGSRVTGIILTETGDVPDVSGMTEVDSIELSNAAGWDYDWTALPTTDASGNPIYYYLVETQVTGINAASVTADYDSAITAAGSVGIITKTTIENKPSAPETGSLIVAKSVTVDGKPTTGDLADGTYTFALYTDEACSQAYVEDGTPVTVSITVQNGASDTATLSGLPEGVYWVKETGSTNPNVTMVANPVRVEVEAGNDFDPSEIPTAQFTNQAYTGSLSLTKTVSGKTDTSTAFGFEITLTAPANVTLQSSYPATHTGDSTLKSVAVSGGKVTGITLKHNEKITISGLPAGTRYAVAETGSYPGYHTGTVSGDSGTIQARTEAQAAVQNVFTANGEVVFSANKNFVNGDLKDKTFTFRLTQVDAVGSTTPVTTKLASTQQKSTISAAGSTQTVTFDKIAFTQADIGATYYFMIDEEAEGLDANGIKDHVVYDTTKHYFTVHVSEAGGQLIITKTPSVSGDGETEAKFTNEQLGRLTVSKLVRYNGAEVSDWDVSTWSFPFAVLDSEGTEVRRSTVAGGDSVTLDDLHYGDYTIVELNEDGTLANNGEVTRGTYSFTVNGGSPVVVGIDKPLNEVTLTNNYEEEAKILVHKVVLVNNEQTEEGTFYVGLFEVSGENEAYVAYREISGGATVEFGSSLVSVGKTYRVYELSAAPAGDSDEAVAADAAAKKLAASAKFDAKEYVVTYDGTQTVSLNYGDAQKETTVTNTREDTDYFVQKRWMTDGVANWNTTYDGGTIYFKLFRTVNGETYQVDASGARADGAAPFELTYGSVGEAPADDTNTVAPDGAQQTVHAGDTMHYWMAFTNLPGRHSEYHAVETNQAGTVLYGNPATGEAYSQYSFYDTCPEFGDKAIALKNKLVKVAVKKAWNGEDYANYRITMQLMQDGVAYGDPVTVTVNTTDVLYTWTDLPMADPATGENHAYTLQETAVYAPGSDANLIDRFKNEITWDPVLSEAPRVDTWTATITNTELIDVEAAKQWRNLPDSDIAAGEYKAGFKLVRYAAGSEQPEAGFEKYGVVDGLVDENNEFTAWTATWTGLEKYDEEGNLYSYVVTEATIDYKGQQQTVLVNGQDPNGKWLVTCEHSGYEWQFVNNWNETTMKALKLWEQNEQKIDWPEEEVSSITVELTRKKVDNDVTPIDAAFGANGKYTLTVTPNRIDASPALPEGVEARIEKKVVDGRYGYDIVIDGLEYGWLDSEGNFNEYTYFLKETDGGGFNAAYMNADGEDSHGEQARDGYTIRNHRFSVSLPATGGAGTGVVYAVGAGLMLLAVLGFIWCSRKRTDGDGI